MIGTDDNINEIAKQNINKPLDESAPRNPSKGFNTIIGTLHRTLKRDTHLNTERCETSMEILLMTEEEPKL